MLGWNISVYLQEKDGLSLATSESPTGKWLAGWETGLGGLKWIDEDVKEGNAIDLGGDGYPMRCSALAKNLIPLIKKRPPVAKDECSGWEVRTTVDNAEIAKCKPDEWLLIEAWDQS